MRNYDVEEIKAELRSRGVDVATSGGNCPLQIEGRVDDIYHFYFRARGSRWTLTIGLRQTYGGNGNWFYWEPYGIEYEAGWMSEERGLWLLLSAVMFFRDEQFGPPKNNCNIVA